MGTRFWEIVAGIGVLVVCLVIGLALGRWLAPKPTIGITRFEGAIDFASADHLMDVLEAARQDDDIAGVVLEIASPGGLATSSESVYYTLLRLREEKPVVVVIDGIAVSGGYYLAAAANQIFAPASSYVGNIGTRGPRPLDPSITPDELSSGPYKLSGGNRFDRIRQMDLVKDAFVNNVVHQRSNSAVNPLAIDAETVAEGRIYLGSEAAALGLIDFEGSRTDAILAAAELAGLRNYAVTDLEDHLNLTPEDDPLDQRNALVSLVNQAPPEAIFLLDSRISLFGLATTDESDQNLEHLRSISPGKLDMLPAEPAGEQTVEEVMPGMDAHE